MSVCGDAQEEFSLSPGRSSPELAAALFQLEAFCLRCDEPKSGYMEKDAMPFAEDPGLLSSEQFPELMAYRSLDASRLRLVGEGQWPMESYLDGRSPRSFCMVFLCQMSLSQISPVRTPRSASSWLRYGMHVDC